mgnify:CR=1 FL=1
MSWTPISNTVPQYEENGISASGFYLKLYLSGTDTPTPMATDFTGATTLDKCQINSKGYPVNGSSAVFIPHIDRKYKIVLYRNETDADNNTTTSAAWVVDELFPIVGSDTGPALTQIPLNSDLRVDTVALLRLEEPTVDGQQISLLGHTNAGIGGGEFYHDASLTGGDDNGTRFVTAGGKVWLRVMKGVATPEMFGGGIGAADDTPALQAATDTNLNVEGAGRGTVYNVITDWFALAFDGKGCTIRTVNAGIHLQKVTGAERNTYHGNYLIDDTDSTIASEGCLILEKGDMWKIHMITATGVLGTGRKGLVIRPFEAYAWIENCSFEHVKFSTFDYTRYVELPNYNATFINQMNFFNCEIRNPGISCMYVDVSAALGGSKKCGNWNFIADEFDGSRQTLQDLIYVKAAGGTSGGCPSWTFIGCALESTTQSHTGYCLNSDDMTAFDSLLFLPCSRHNFQALVNPAYTGRLIQTRDAAESHLRNMDMEGGSITGADISDTKITQLKGLITGSTGGTSTYSPGQTRAAHTLPSVLGYYDYELVVHPVNAASLSIAQVTRVICGPFGATAVDLMPNSDFSSSMSGASIQFTNDNAATMSARYTWRYYLAPA